MVMCKKYRKKMLDRPGYSEKLADIINGIGERYEFEIEELGTDGDHIHVFVGASGRWAPSNIMKVLKSISAREMFQTFPEIRKQLWGGEFWSDGGYIGTVGEGTTVEIVRKYIREQGSTETHGSYRQMDLFRKG